MKKLVLIILSILFVFFGYKQIIACTNILVSKGATKDGSTMITYAADSHELYGELYYFPAQDHIKGEMLKIYEWDTGKYLGKIPQVDHTYSVVGNINEYQVSIGETTWGGRKELRDKKAIMDYGSLMYIALQRAKTAREAIKVITELVEKYGYYSSGESFSVSDPNEVWILEMISKGEKEKGAVWAARKIPDGYISVHANQARIRQFPLNDKENCLYSEDVISFAREMGYFKGKDKDFNFADTYAPADFGALRFCEARVWSVFRKVAPSVKYSLDYIKGDTEADPLPIWVKVEEKLSVRDVIELMRDHFEGTELDLSKGVGAGPYKLPYRWRPLIWEYKDKKYFNERAISTQQTGFSFVAQSRSEFPDPIGGILWFSVDDTYSTVYVPMYCGIKKIPESYAVGNGSFHKFSWDSAFWVFNFVSNYAYSRYNDMIEDIQKVQRELEGRFIAMQPEIDKAAFEMYKKSPQLARDYLTNYCVEQGNMVVKRWKKLGEFLIYKYLDGNIKDEKGNVTHPGYPESWYRRIVEENGDKFRMPKEKKENNEE